MPEVSRLGAGGRAVSAGGQQYLREKLSLASKV